MFAFDHLDAIDCVLQSELSVPEIKIILYEHLAWEKPDEVKAPNPYQRDEE